MNIDKLFKEHYDNLIINFDPVLYDDKYMEVLVGENTTIALENLSTDYKINIINKDQHILNTHDEELTLSYNSYSRLLTLSKKILGNFIDATITYIPYHNPILMEIMYITKKYFSECTTILDEKHFKDIRKFETPKYNLGFINYNVETNKDTLFKKLSEGNVLIYAADLQAIYKYYSNTELFVSFYNILIKMKKGDCTVGIKIKTEFYLNLIFDIIDVLRRYFKYVHLVNTKYYPRIYFILIVKNKIKDYDKNDEVVFTPNTNRLFNTNVDKQYISFMNTIFTKRSDKIIVFMALDNLKKNNPVAYELAVSRINNYKSLDQ